ncbi:MAG TPA: exodeoxyribonuclease VII large subunit [Candidatus Choladousia intestinavium]|uniref:Exodeoxyribonuclease 7 large subunit n=1 Tax=Candidatus Choladousia intestinavium TaxID=2840727 RepID=A0A9D1D7X0_9FIRM|nr:exodeoxyribonuclease VII large subunit [Candidatus Choladousia intestinavium]
MQKVYSVGQVNAYIKNMFVQDFVLNRISVRGEVSNCKYHTSGHIYFSLKDSAGAMACVMFASARKGLAFRLSDGQQVVVQGSVSVYERDGRYQLYAREIRQDGAGILYEQYLKLKQELEEMGMFAREYKKNIPPYVSRLGVVTAPTGAAVRDIINIARRRNPGIQIILYPAKVQGEGAAKSVAEGIQALDRLGVDVMIVGRGGGSIEDLWAFNEELVARAIFACSTPLISAVGHETDTTIADFVADLRAPTPSAAAELAVTDMSGVLSQILEYHRRLSKNFEYRLEAARQKRQQLTLRFKYVSPTRKLWEMQQRLAEDEDRLLRGMKERLGREQHRLEVYIEKLKGLSPLEKLSSGYSVAAVPGQGRLWSVKQLKEGDPVRVYLSDGYIEGRAEKICPATPEGFEKGETDGENRRKGENPGGIFSGTGDNSCQAGR